METSSGQYSFSYIDDKNKCKTVNHVSKYETATVECKIAVTISHKKDVRFVITSSCL